jgi:long-chain acyl-CoA synthetase
MNPQDQTLCDVVAELARSGDRVALLALRKEGITEWSYAALADLVGRVAGGLGAGGVGPGTRVALLAAHSAEWVVAALATLHAGATLVPIDPQCDPQSLTHIVEDCGAAFWFASAQTEARLRERIQETARTFRLDGLPEDPRSWHRLAAHERVLPAVAHPDDEAVLFYTSGTTGLPKGVPLNHRNLVFQTTTLRHFGMVKDSERILLALPLHHVYPFSIGLLGSLALGGTIVVPRALTGPEIVRALRECAVTAIVGVPRLYEVFLSGVKARVRARGRARGAAFSALLHACIALRRRFGIRLGAVPFRRLLAEFGGSVHLVVSGGAALDEDLAWAMDGIGWTVATGYGLTETAPLLTLLPPGDTHFSSVGRPVPGVDIRIVPLERQPEEAGVAMRHGTGEIQARGPGVFAGYHRLPEKTAAAFTGDGWFRTGDLGYFDRDGYLHVLGRHGTLIVTSAGEHIQPETLEAHFATYTGIREIGVLQRDGMLMGVVVPDYKELRRRGVTDVDAAIRDAVVEAGKRLPSHQRLSRYVISRDTLPRTRLGKIRRPGLAQRFEDIEAGAQAEPGRMPATMSDEDKALLDEPAAQMLWQWIGERFPNRPLSPDTSLALDLGVDSLEWINMTLDMRQRTGIEISEDATGRIETLRDLLNESVMAERGALAATADFLALDPERFISATQARWLRPLSRGEEIGARLLYRLNRLAMRALFRLEITGRENLPARGNFICAPNHASFLDPFAVAAAIDFDRLRHTYWAGWTGMAFANALFRIVSRLAQVLPIEQERAAYSSLAMSLLVLQRGKNLIWFAEGGRSRDGRLQAFRTGISLLLLHQPTPVVPMLITGTYDAMPIGRRLPRLRPVRIVIGRPLSVDELERGGQGATRAQRIADGLREAIRSLATESPVIDKAVR